MNKLVVISVVLAICVGTTFATNYNLPTNISTNPQGNWSLEYASGAVWSKKADLSLMQSGSVFGEPFWVTPNGQGIPRVQMNSQSTTWLTSGNPQVNSATVLVFRAPADGWYSIDLTWLSAWGSTDTTVEYLEVRTAPDTQTAASVLWQSSHTWMAGGSQQYYYDNLSSQPALQNIRLNAGSYLFFSMSSYAHPGLPIALNQFLDSSTQAIGGMVKYTPSSDFALPVSISANPQGNWSVEYAQTAVWDSKTDLNLMQEGLLWGTEPFWVTPIGQGIPRVQRNSTATTWLVSGNPLVNSAAVLVFQAPVDGVYSIDFTWMSAWGSTDPTVEYLDVRSAPDSQTKATVLWQTSHTWQGSQQNYYDNLSDQPALQNIRLQAGNYVFFSMSSYPNAGLPVALNQFLDSDTLNLGGTIKYVCYQEGDLSGDCKVNIKDFAILAAEWLKCANPNNISCVVESSN